MSEYLDDFMYDAWDEGIEEYDQDEDFRDTQEYYSELDEQDLDDDDLIYRQWEEQDADDLAEYWSTH